MLPDPQLTDFRIKIAPPANLPGARRVAHGIPRGVVAVLLARATGVEHRRQPVREKYVNGWDRPLTGF